jgi:hypothetical protein
MLYVLHTFIYIMLQYTVYLYEYQSTEIES